MGPICVTLMVTQMNPHAHQPWARWILASQVGALSDDEGEGGMLPLLGSRLTSPGPSSSERRRRPFSLSGTADAAEVLLAPYAGLPVRARRASLIEYPLDLTLRLGEVGSRWTMADGGSPPEALTAARADWVPGWHRTHMHARSAHAPPPPSSPYACASSRPTY